MLEFPQTAVDQELCEHLESVSIEVPLEVVRFLEVRFDMLCRDELLLAGFLEKLYLSETLFELLLVEEDVLATLDQIYALGFPFFPNFHNIYLLLNI